MLCHCDCQLEHSSVSLENRNLVYMIFYLFFVRREISLFLTSSDSFLPLLQMFWKFCKCSLNTNPIHSFLKSIIIGRTSFFLPAMLYPTNPLAQSRMSEDCFWDNLYTEGV